MRVLWICGADRLGGAETATLQLATTLRTHGHAVVALCRSRGPVWRALEACAIPARSAPFGGAPGLLAAPSIARARAETRADVVLVTTIGEWLPACLLQRRTSATRLVLVRHMALPLSRPLAWLAGRRADAIVAVSAAVRDSLLARPGIHRDRLHVIYNPTRYPARAAPPSAEERAQARRAFGLPASGHCIGFFGGLNHRKGVADVAAAVQRANQTIGPTHLLLCGGADRRRNAPTASELMERYALRGILHYRGEVGDVARALTAADIVVVATHRRLNEALPATLIEAMACGTPVLAYATGGMREVIGDEGEAGRLAAADDADDLGRVLTAMLADPAATANLAAAGLMRARRLFDAEQAAQRYEQLFAALATPAR
jgi:glycosyltransferase involved in cell wall biosynthesis